MLGVQPLHDGFGRLVLVIGEVEHESVGGGHVGVFLVDEVSSRFHEVDRVHDLGRIWLDLLIGPVHPLACGFNE